jgi:cytochrome c
MYIARWQLLNVAFFGLLTAAIAEDEMPGLGHALSPQEADAVDFVIMPDGTGLPAGSGNAKSGAALFQAHCAACHGSEGRNGINDALVGGQGTIAGPTPEKTVGSYWPYATTLFDYVRRAMPYQNPGSLTNDELYSITAYVLWLNGIVAPSDTIDATALPEVKMPNRDKFVSAVERGG